MLAMCHFSQRQQSSCTTSYRYALDDVQPQLVPALLSLHLSGKLDTCWPINRAEELTRIEERKKNQIDSFSIAVCAVEFLLSCTAGFSAIIDLSLLCCFDVGIVERNLFPLDPLLFISHVRAHGWIFQLHAILQSSNGDVYVSMNLNWLNDGVSWL